MKNSLTNTTPSGRDIQSGSGGHNEFRNLISHFWNFFDNPTADSDLVQQNRTNNLSCIFKVFVSLITDFVILL